MVARYCFLKSVDDFETAHKMCSILVWVQFPLNPISTTTTFLTIIVIGWLSNLSSWGTNYSTHPKILKYFTLLFLQNTLILTSYSLVAWEAAKGVMCPQSEAIPVPPPPSEEKNAKVSHFQQASGFLSPQKYICPLDAPPPPPQKKKIWYHHLMYWVGSMNGIICILYPIGLNVFFACFGKDLIIAFRK